MKSRAIAVVPIAEGAMPKRSKPVSLTPKSKTYLESQGYLVGRTEHWNSFANIRQDLFGFIDLLAIKDTGPIGKIVAVQVTSRGNISSRVRKIKLSPHYTVLVKAGVIVVVHGWDKDGKRWRLKEVTVDETPWQEFT